MKIADAVSRRWLERSHYPYLAEIDRIAARIARPGAYFLNLSYEWRCTSSVENPHRSPDAQRIIGEPADEGDAAEHQPGDQSRRPVVVGEHAAAGLPERAAAPAAWA